jgi:hypothetical protein
MSVLAVALIAVYAAGVLMAFLPIEEWLRHLSDKNRPDWEFFAVGGSWISYLLFRWLYHRQRRRLYTALLAEVQDGAA